MTEIQVPYDAMEAVTGAAEEVRGPEERAAAVEMLEKARRLSNVREHGYDLKTSFVSYGATPSDGPWLLEDTSPGRGLYRWTAQGPGFSRIFLQANGLLSSDEQDMSIPARLVEVRDAMWSVYLPGISPNDGVRVSNGSVNGSEVRCVLVARYGTPADRTFSAGRSVVESEHCVNTQSGLLEQYSPYPGLYVRYDYSGGLRFHELTIPDRFTISEHGKVVVEAKTDNVGEPAPASSGIFQGSNLKPIGVGNVVQGAITYRTFQNSPLVEANGNNPVVVMHGMLSDGKLTDFGVISSTSDSWNDAAQPRPQMLQMLTRAEDRRAQTGAVPVSRELVITVVFIPQPPRSGCVPQGASGDLNGMHTRPGANQIPCERP